MRRSTGRSPWSRKPVGHPGKRTARRVVAPHGASGFGDKRADDIRPYRVGSYPPVARGTPALRRQAPTAARRARPVQRSGCQGLPGDRRGPPRRGSACHETKKGTGRGCTPGSCFVCTAFRRHEPPYWGVQGGRSPPALLSPHFFGKKWGRPPRRHPPGGWASTRRADTIRPYGLGSWRTALVRPAPWQTAGRVVPHRWGARRAGIGEPLIRPSERTGAPSPRWGEGSGRAMRAPRGRARFRTKKRAARDTGGACVYRSSRKYAKPRLAGGCLSRLLRREVKISTTTVTT